MVKPSISALLPLLLATNAAAFKCATHTFTQCADGITHWYDPDDGQICDPLDCGGGRAPPKYNKPGCAAYTGTEAFKTGPSYLPCWKPSTASVAPSVSKTQPAPESKTTASEAASKPNTSVSIPASNTASVAPVTTASSATDSASAANPTTTTPAALTTKVQTGGSDTDTISSGSSTAGVASTSTQTGQAVKGIDGPIMVLAAGALGIMALA